MENHYNSKNCSRGNLRELSRQTSGEYGILKSLQTATLDNNLDVLNHHIDNLKNKEMCWNT